MSDAQVFDSQLRHECPGGVLTFDEGWALKVFMVRAQERSFPQAKDVHRVLASILTKMTKRLSPEFDYGLFGFAIVHMGNRGICITVNHFGGWGSTFETFSSGWYRYGHLFEEFELLNDMEPAMCWFEVARSFAEISAACRLAEDGHFLSEIRARYLSLE